MMEMESQMSSITMMTTMESQIPKMIHLMIMIMMV